MKTAALTLATLATALPLHGQGPLTPPGPPAATMKSLDQIEPRTPVSSLPATLSAPGSYYLTGNLQFSSVGSVAINITSNDVTLDLGGHTLSSAPSITASCIAISPGLRGVTVKNGTIAGTTSVTISGTAPSRSWTVAPGGFGFGIADSGEGTRIEDIIVRGCRSRGISGPNSGTSFILTRVSAIANGSTGIHGINGNMTQCLSSGNGGVGIQADHGIVANCLSRDNGGNGIQAENGTIASSSSNYNGGSGIYGSRCSISGSGASYNAGDGVYSFYGSVDGGTFSNNTGDGIEAPYAAIRGVAACMNGGHGINGSYSTIDHTTAYKNTGSGINSTQGSLTGCNARENTMVDIYVTGGAVAFCKYPTGTTTSSTLTGNQTP